MGASSRPGEAGEVARPPDPPGAAPGTVFEAAAVSEKPLIVLCTVYYVLWIISTRQRSCVFHQM